MLTFGSTAVMAGGSKGVVLVVGTAILICFSPFFKLPQKIALFFNYLGNISYPLYLTHMATMFLVYNFSHSRNSMLYAVLILLMSILVFHAVDVPARKVRRLFD